MEKLKRKQIEAGSILIRENDHSRKLFILRKGKVRVFKNYMGGKIVLAVLRPGEIFGELSFFDNKPRSASVEALTDVVVDTIDGEALSTDIENLPPWLKLIFSSVANRFRIVDQKMTVLQSLSNFQRKTLSKDAIGNKIYTDLLRIIKIIKMLINEKGNNQTKEELTKQLNETVGNSLVAPKAFLNVMLDYDFISTDDYENNRLFVINEEVLTDFENFLKLEYKKDTCTILAHQSIALLRKIISYLETEDLNNNNESIPLSKQAIDSYDEKETAEALNQLIKLGIIQLKDNVPYIQPANIIKSFKYYNIVKSFDHTIVYSD